jgi:hypothetical protein
MQAKVRTMNENGCMKKVESRDEVIAHSPSRCCTSRGPWRCSPRHPAACPRTCRRS